MGDGSYEIRDRLARGGMADIFLAQDRNSQYVVLRRLREPLAGTWATVRQFNWGNKVTEQLSHPNIVHFIESGKTGKLPWVALEYIEGPNLRELILNDYPTVKKQMMRLLIGMASALNHVHEQGYLHLDFKPENILVPRDFNVKLIDFDLCMKKTDGFIKLKKLAGTPSYLSPEALEKKIVDERSDIFAFGVAAYEVLTGRKPVPSESLQDVYRAYMNLDEEIRMPREFNKEISIQLQKFILQCLSKDVERRYPIMSLVMRDLHSCE